jgi:hypothetical protein
MKTAVFCAVAPCADVSEVLAASIIRAIMEAEELVNFYHTTRRINPEDSHLH